MTAVKSLQKALRAYWPNINAVFPRLRVWHLSYVFLRGAEIRNSTHDIYLVKVKVSEEKKGVEP